MHKLNEQQRKRAQSRYRADLEDVERLSRSLNKVERQYQAQQIKYNEEVDKKLQEIKERYKPVDYTALCNFSTAYDSRKVQMQLELEEKQQRERSRNKDILPLLQSYNRAMSKTSENFHKDFFARKKEKVKMRVNKMKGYGNYVKKHFLPPITTKANSSDDNGIPNTERRRERFGKAIANTAEEKLGEYSVAVRTREIGMNYLKELKEEVKKAEAENRVKKPVKEEVSQKINYKNYLKEIESVRRDKDKENMTRVEHLVNEIKGPVNGQLKDVVTNIDVEIRKTFKNSADGYVQTIKAKLDLLNKLN